MNTHKAIQTGTDKNTNRLLNANFNQDYGCFAICTDSGFKVYNTDPLELRVERSFDKGIGSITMLHRTNYLALVGGGRNPCFAVNKVVIWDDLKKKKSLELEFTDNVVNVLLSRTRIVVVLRNSVVVYGFSSPPRLISKYDTIENVDGIAELSSGTSTPTSDTRSSASPPPISDGVARNFQILAFPGRSTGQIQLVDISSAGQERNLVSLIKAHKSQIKALLINAQLTMIASLSETGTIVRVHSVKNCSLLFEFRRGLDKLIIYSMRFSPNGSKLAVLSDKNTLHIYSISAQVSNKSHLFNSTLMPKYFKSQWSFLSCHLDASISDHALELGVGDAGVGVGAGGGAVGAGARSLHNNNNNDVGVLGWADEESVIVIWKHFAKWEKYVLIEKENRPGEYELIRESWRKLL